MPGPSFQRASASKAIAVLTVWLPVIAVVVGLSLAAGAYFGLYRPKLGEMISGGRYDLAPMSRILTASQDQMAKVSETVDAYSRMNAEHRLRIAAAMPLKSDVPGIILQLDAIARANNMALVSIDATPDEKAASSRRSVRITADIRGADYQQFKVFLADIERSLRPIDVQTVSFAAPGGSYGLTMNAYWLDTQYVETAKKPAAAAPAVLSTEGPAGQ